MAATLEIEEGKVDNGDALKKVLLDTIYFYAQDKEQEFSNSAKKLPQFPSFVGNAVRTITFWAQFNQFQLQNHKKQCIISVGSPEKVQDFNIVLYSKHIGIMGYGVYKCIVYLFNTYIVVHFRMYCNQNCRI